MDSPATWESPTRPWAQCDERRQEDLYLAWSTGNLRWKLDPEQRKIHDAIYASHATVKSSLERVFCMDLARRSGKDFIMSIIALQEIYKNRRYMRIPYAAPTKDNVHEILIPTFEGIFADCPPELLPYEIAKHTFRTNSPELNWDWGGRIPLIGVDLHPDWLRGPSTDCFMFTEPGFVENLDDIMTGVMLPQLLTNPKGFVVMGSTPPVTPGHAWSQKYVPEAKARGMWIKRTVYENPRISAHDVAGAMSSCGGAESTKWRREYMCEHIIESTLAVIPEYTDARDKILTTEGFDDPPAYRDTYVAIDPGYAHATGGVFAYYDYTHDLLMIEGDFNTQGLNSNEVARRVKAREWQLWGRPPHKPSKLTEQAWKLELELIKSHFYPGLPMPRNPVISWRDGTVKADTFRRVSDTDSRLIADLSAEHALLFVATEKDHTEVHTNALRLRIQDHKIRIHPRCVNLDTHLAQATWNKARTKLAESKGGGHFDCLKSAEYLQRNTLWGKNPFPPAKYDKNDYHVPPGANSALGRTADALSRAFSGARTRRR